MPNRTPKSTLMVLLILAALATGPLYAAGEGTGEKPSGTDLSGLTASIDPQSLAVREPTDEQIAALRAELEVMLADQVSPKEGTSGEHPRGGRYFVVPNRLMEAIFVQVGAGGELNAVCADLEQIPEILARPAPTSKAPLR